MDGARRWQYLAVLLQLLEKALSCTADAERALDVAVLERLHEHALDLLFVLVLVLVFLILLAATVCRRSLSQRAISHAGSHASASINQR